MGSPHYQQNNEETLTLKFSLNHPLSDDLKYQIQTEWKKFKIICDDKFLNQYSEEQKNEILQDLILHDRYLCLEMKENEIRVVPFFRKENDDIGGQIYVIPDNYDDLIFSAYTCRKYSPKWIAEIYPKEKKDLPSFDRKRVCFEFQDIIKLKKKIWFVDKKLNVVPLVNENPCCI